MEQQPQTEVPPPPPVPVEAYFPAALPYAVGQQRPTLVSTIAILSIVFGALGFGFNGLLLLYAGGMYAASKAAGMAAGTTTISTPSTTVISSDHVVTGPEGLSDSDRQLVLPAFEQVEPLSAAQRTQLDLLLAQHGQSILPLQEIDRTPQMIRTKVSDSGSNPQSGYGGREVYFVLPAGRISVADRSATFNPSGRGAVVTTSASVELHRALTDEEVEAVLEKIEFQASKSLTDVQAAAVRQALQAQDQDLILTSDPQNPPEDQVSFSYGTPDGQISITFDSGGMMVDAKGTVSQSWSMSRPYASSFNIPDVPAVLTIVGLFLCLGLAIYLFVAGILTLRLSPSGGTLHRIYAWVKIPLTLGTMAAWGWMWSAVFGNMFANSPVATGSADTGTVFAWIATGIAVMGCAYPVALLIMLRTRAMREFYSPMAAG